MILLSVGFTPEKCEVYDKLNELTAYFKDRGINIGLIESENGGIHFVKCILCDEDSEKCCFPEVKEAFNIYAANILYEIIADNFEVDILSKIVKDNYYYLKPDEIDRILSKCTGVLNGTDVMSGDNYLLYLNRKNKIVSKILEYIADNTDIVIEGFLRFRLRELNSDLEDIVDKVVEDFLIEREYDEFIKLLRYFVEVQESRIDVVNIVIEQKGNYCMYDSNYSEITGDLLKDLIGESLNGEANCDDLLVSSLITMAPRYIIIHNMSNVINQEVIETIKNVFYDRIKECPGCELCFKTNPIHRV